MMGVGPVPAIRGLLRKKSDGSSIAARRALLRRVALVQLEWIVAGKGPADLV
jgi:hypothetical protein